MQENFRRSLKFRMNSYLENFQRESFSQRFEIYCYKNRMPIHSFVCEIWIDIFRFFRESAPNSKLTLFMLKIFYYCFYRNICYVIGRAI
ncbi:hypothetical protein C0J52_15508 [Blattella germanica]|nr:hypothetical protein C0J52_15508 [Blattella germanica]